MSLSMKNANRSESIFARVLKALGILTVTIAVAGALCALAIPQARADGVKPVQMFDISKIKQAPHFPLLSQDDFEKVTDLFEDDPQDDKHLAYQVHLPKGWKKLQETQIGHEDDDGDYYYDASKMIRTRKKTANDMADSGNMLSRRILGKIAKYYSPNTGVEVPSRFEIRAIELDHEITTKNWFLNFIMTNSYSLEGMEEISDSKVEGLYILVENGVSYVVRTDAQINGNRMVLMSYYVPDSRWQVERNMQEQCLSSFRFTNPEKVLIEKTKPFSYLDLLTFEYPSSWKLIVPNIYSVEGMDARLLNSSDNTTLNGEIQIHIVSSEMDTTLAQEVQYLKDELKKEGLRVGDLIEAVPEGTYKFDNQISFNRVETYKVDAKKQRIREHEYWLAVLVEDRYYYFISMLTPSRDDDFYLWARNTEAFQIVIQSMKPNVNENALPERQ
jgi:hypothetical protein